MIIRVYRNGFIVSEKLVIFSGKKYLCGKDVHVHNMMNETCTISPLKTKKIYNCRSLRLSTCTVSLW